VSEDPGLEAEIGALWRTEVPAFDAGALRRALEQDQARRRRSEWLSVGIQLALLPLIAWMDLQDAFPLQRGVVTAVLLAGVIGSVLTIFWRRRPIPVPASPLHALELAIASKRRLRRHGLLLTIGLPLGMGTGYGVAALLDDGAPGYDAPTAILVLLLAIAVVASVLCAARGTAIFGQARRELAELEDRRRELEL
jgi:hypothetical protein